MSKVGFSRKISLSQYSGKQYETADFWIEMDEGDDVDFKIAVEKVHTAIEEYIKGLPASEARFKEAKDKQPPFG